MANNREHIERIQVTFEHLHHYSAAHSATVPAHEVFRDQTVWQGDIEAFTLTWQPKAQGAHGGSEGHGDKERFFAVLEILLLKSAAEAVRASIVADAKKGVK
jgi:hypothetical protein